MKSEKNQETKEQSNPNEINLDKENNLAENIIPEEPTVGTTNDESLSEKSLPKIAGENETEININNDDLEAEEIQNHLTEIAKNEVLEKIADENYWPEVIGTESDSENFQIRGNKKQSAPATKRLVKSARKLAYFEAACAVKSFLLGYQVRNLNNPLYKTKKMWFELYKPVKNEIPPNTTILQAAFMIRTAGYLAIAKKFASEAEKEDWKYFSDVDIQESRKEPLAFIIQRITQKFFTIAPIIHTPSQVENEADRFDTIARCCQTLCEPSVWAAIETIANLILSGNPPSNKEAEEFFKNTVKKGLFSFYKLNA